MLITFLVIIGLIILFVIINPFIPETQQTESLPRTIEDCKVMEDGEDKEGCFMELALYNKNISICNYLDYEDFSRSFCYATHGHYTNNLSVCTLDDSGEDCYYALIQLYDDVKICNEIVLGREILSVEDEAEQLFARSYCFYSYAWFKQDDSYCNLAEDEIVKETCLSSLNITMEKYG